MPLQLTDGQIETTCRELLAQETTPSVRGLRRLLRARYGVVGRTDRVCAIWRRMYRAGADSSPVSDPERQRWLARVHAAEERARLAEEREIKHQDKWASEVHELRERLRGQQHIMVSGVSHETYLRVHQELQKVRDELALLKLGISRGEGEGA